MDRIAALGLFVLTCGVWFNASAGHLRGLLFLLLVVLIVAHHAARFLKYVLLLPVLHVAVAAWGVTTTLSPAWTVKYTLALSNGMYLVAGALVILLFQGLGE